MHPRRHAIALPAALLACLFFACEDKPKNPVAEYGDSMINAYQQGQKAGETGNVNALQQAVDAYHAANDRFPERLEDVSNLIGQDVDFSLYDYDPSSGKVSCKILK